MFVYFEAINFGSCMLDTNDLATMRGGSIAADCMPAAALAFLKERFNTAKDCGGGASKALIKIDGVGHAELVQAASEFVSSAECQVLTVTFGIGDSAAAAKNDSVIRSCSVWSFTPLSGESDATKACPVDHIRPAVEEDYDAEGKKRLVSPHVARRRKIGRTGQTSRPRLFKGTHLYPPHSFDEICEPPSPKFGDIPPVVRDKIAVISIDGIGGGDLEKKVNGIKPEKRTALGQDDIDRMSLLAKSFYAEVAKGMVDWIDETGLTYTRTDKEDIVRRFARLDVLTWAGDDMIFFLPAYAAVPFVQTFLKLIDREFDPEVTPGLRFRHRIGVVLAQKKVPIRQLVKVAKMLEDAARDGPKDASLVATMALESAAPPHSTIYPYWLDLYGEGHKPEMDIFTAREFSALADCCVRIAGEPENALLTTTQVNRALRLLGVPHRAIMPANGEDRDASDARVTKNLERFSRNVHQQAFDRDAEFPGLCRHPLPMLLAHVAQLSPYATAGQQFAGGNQ